MAVNIFFEKIRFSEPRRLELRRPNCGFSLYNATGSNMFASRGAVNSYVLLVATNQGDYQRRMAFLEWLAPPHEDGNISSILWTDESRFHNNGTIYRHNCHYWSEDNPHWMRETKTFKEFGN
ncbi:hypothetical protein NQ318_005901 [Aromia moschata]|uniref:Uncharacterized protein n=1 Tax=Aromia moschata TaxID=1265417 RepID=A0AAV8YQW3_9CUCU|nr:hypothetical protein NQ318_005901 [Aromia moschata]